MSRRFYELRRLRPHGLGSEEIGTFSTEAKARKAMSSWRRDCQQWQFRISLIVVDVVHDDVRLAEAIKQGAE